MQSYKDAKLMYQNTDSTSAVLSVGRIAHLESELREAQVTLSVMLLFAECELREVVYVIMNVVRGIVFL